MASSKHHPTLLSQEQVYPPQEELYMLSKRDSKEKDRWDLGSTCITEAKSGSLIILYNYRRLDQQSNLIRIIRDGCVLDPSIPKENVRRIADIATGTGYEPQSIFDTLTQPCSSQNWNWLLLRIWLREVTTELASYGRYKGSPPYETVGFDISSDQFPAAPEPHSKFVVWDATTTFPAEYHGLFDVVHVRLITVAVTVDQIKLMTRNLVQLLSKWDIYLAFYIFCLGQVQNAAGQVANG